jgi:soluble lytic murein transglycosylase
MMMWNCSVRITRVLWFSGLGVAASLGLLAQRGNPTTARHLGAVTPKDTALAALVKTWRQSPTPARRASLEAYARAHAGDANGPLARLALGVGSYEQKDFAAAVTALTGMAGRLPRIADYAAYYLAAAQLELKSAEDIGKELAVAHPTEVRSPLSGRAWLVEARALQTTQPPESVRILREHYSELPQPEGDVTLADSYQAASDPVHAADFYQRVYYQYVSGDAALRAAAALLTLKDTMGERYPAPLGAQMLQRAGRLLDARQYDKARAEFQSAADQTTGLDHERALVRLGQVDYLAGKTTDACTYWNRLEVGPSDAGAERLFDLEECNRRLGNEAAMMQAVDQLAKDYPQSPWRLKALVGAANRYLVTGRPDEYVPLYTAAYEMFPADPDAGLYHWRVAFQAYMRRKSEAGDLLREQLRNYGSHGTAGTALYFLGRLYEQNGDLSSARACYRKLADSYQNHYYSMLARDRLARPEVAAAVGDSAADAVLAEVKLAQAPPIPAIVTGATTARIERSRLLRSAGLDDLADGELRFGARNGGQGSLLGMELAASADSPHQALHIMKAMAPDYLNLNLDAAPRKFWELLFPLPYRTELESDARQRGLDPFLVAGLIRQESEFDPEALSPAKAYGLTQVLPVTGREFARKAGIPRFNTRLLWQPAVNLRIGTSVLRSMLDSNGGHLEQTLAAYNAGPSRVTQWSGWNEYREAAEFVESIPFNETRDYVQAVLRNADTYRRLYASTPERASTQGPSRH